MVDELEFLTRDIVDGDALNVKGRARAEFIARAMKGETARRLAILYAEVAKLAGPEPKPRKRRAKRATR